MLSSMVRTSLPLSSLCYYDMQRVSGCMEVTRGIRLSQFCSLVTYKCNLSVNISPCKALMYHKQGWRDSTARKSVVVEA